MQATMDHAELHVSKPDETIPFYKDLLTHFEWNVVSEWPGGLGISDGHVSLWFFATPEEHREQSFNRDATGISHLGLRLPSREAVEAFTRDYLAHPVRVEAGTRLGQLLGDEAPVNSMHHQGIKRLAGGLKASAFAPDGLVEGVESEDGHYLVGVQWHPEELAEAHAPQRRLFADFLDAAGAFHGR